MPNCVIRSRIKDMSEDILNQVTEDIIINAHNYNYHYFTNSLRTYNIK